jgi:hypothetical protein
MTPTIRLLGNPNFTTALSKVLINSFTVAGAEQADDPQPGSPYPVYARVYENRHDAETLASSGWIGIGTTLYLSDGAQEKRPLTNKEYDNGYAGTEPNAIHGAEIEGLTANKNYYIVFYMRIDAKDVPLIDAETAGKAVYAFTTSDKVVFSSAQGIIYTNSSYFEKSLKLNFSLNRYFGISLRYDILNAAGDAIVLSHEQLTAPGGILTAPTTAPVWQNTLSVDLTPAPARTLLQPGGRYKLRISATEGSGTSNEQDAGAASFDFSLPVSGNNGALVYIAGAAKDFIDFQVTLTDSQFSFMGHRDDQGRPSAAGALYAVRFTYFDKQAHMEKRLWTVYDDDIFFGQNPKQLFRLSDATLYNNGRNPAPVDNRIIQPNTEYRLHVFAIYDMDHDGQSDLPIVPGGAEQEWSYFFTDDEDYVGALGDGGAYSKTDGDPSCGAAFLSLIDKFWMSGYNGGPGINNTPENPEIVPNNPEWYTPMSPVLPGFLAAQKSQQTTDDDGTLVNETQATIARLSVTQLQLVLAESFGIITEIDGEPVQVFKRVDWSVNGYTDAGVNVNKSGNSSANATPPAAMFEQGWDRAGYNIYSYLIPTEITSGSYTVTIQLRMTDSDIAPVYKTLSFRYRG